MSVIKVIGIDLGKSVFHLIGHDHSGREIYRLKLSRVKLVQFISKQETTTIAMKACCGAHWLA
ncbi:mobile element protein [Vibrio astriarenae]|nr:mobile element protein [Vibrio sp. C7]